MAFVPLNFDAHKSLKVNEIDDYSFVDTSHLFPLTLFEVGTLGLAFPLIFVKHAETGQFQFVAMTGLEPGKNLFVKDGKWIGEYVPKILECRPFRLMADQNDSELMHIGIDTDSEIVSQKKGEAIFSKDGSHTEWFAGKKELLSGYYEQTLQTQMFCKELVNLDLLKENSLSLNSAGTQRVLNSIYLIDRDKLAGLSNEDFLALRDRGLLPLIFGQIASLGNIKKLVERDYQ